MVISYDWVVLQRQNKELQEENEELKQKIRDLQEKIRRQNEDIEALKDASEEDTRTITDLKKKNMLLRQEATDEINRVDEFIVNMKSMNVFQFVEFVNNYEEDMSK